MGRRPVGESRKRWRSRPDPTKRKRGRNVKPSPSIQSLYDAEPSVKTTKFTAEEESIINYLTRGSTNDLCEVLICIEGAKWPLTRKEVGESFRPRGLVCNMSNLLAAQSDEFNNLLRDDCDPDKVGYDVLKCNMGFVLVRGFLISLAAGVAPLSLAAAFKIDSGVIIMLSVILQPISASIYLDCLKYL
ncbi:hypothetical protein RHSIM_RhsimUnG0238400 [Rhododendron simsii]|uniref:Uncharacterized protein n=1 Tax=Rhododendron simsii TaxID=118357 RepID=A0A834FTD6_RHOSS|nr:hypothetical protein RHSIM_RhsimUnG0238400 [Rhododendron simsii]